MKKFSLYIVFFICAISFAQETPVKIEVDTTNIRIGEQIQYKILVEKDDKVQFSKFKLDENKKVEVVEEQKTDTTPSHFIKRFILTSFDSGAYVVPRQQVIIDQKSYLTDSILISVATVEVDTLKQNLFPIKNIQEQPIIFDDYKNYVWIGLAILGLIIAVILYFVLRKKKEEIPLEQRIPPFELAMMRLGELDKKQLIKQEKIKQYYVELTDIVRSYIERELKIPALESTTDELIETIKDFDMIKTLDLPKSTIRNLQNLLSEADLVKFAKSKPAYSEIELHRSSTEKIITNLKPKIEESKEGEEESIQEEPIAKQKKPLNKKLILGILIGLVVGVITYIGVKKLVFSAVVDTVFSEVVAELNEEAPIMIDSETRLDNAEVLPNKTIQYNYTMMNYSLGDIDIVEFEKSLKPVLVNSIKTNPEMELLRGEEVTFIYNYSDKNGYALTKLIITSDDYNE